MKLDRLPAHITGFRDRKEQPPRRVPAVEFKRACYAVAQADGGSVEEFDASLFCRNFYSATLKTFDGHVGVICNCTQPYLAFVSVDVTHTGPGPMPYIAPVHLGALFTALTMFQPMDADWLASDLQDQMLENLTSAECRQVSYWEPRTIGEVVFNNWD